MGTITWGHHTAIEEDSDKNFTGNWTLSAGVSAVFSGDAEKIVFNNSNIKSTTSEIYNLGSMTAILTKDKYGTDYNNYFNYLYKTGVTSAACASASWNDITLSTGFTSLGYIQLKITTVLNRGIFCGGYDGSNYDVIDYITINSTGNATDFGDLSVARFGLAATSNA